MSAWPDVRAPETDPRADTTVATLANGVRVVTIRLPQLETASLSVFVRTGSAHEERRLNGISHFVEHMAFKGTHTRSCQQINFDAERLGAEVNAHTDKDHTAYHMRGLARDAGVLLRMLGDIVRNSSFPQDELERERQVILQEYIEDDDDTLSTAFKLFDKACFGLHPVAQPVIGMRTNIERFARTDVLGYVQRQYSGANVIVGVAGNVDPDDVLRDAEAAFGSMHRGEPNVVPPPHYRGGLKTVRDSGCSQTHVVLGFPTPALADDAHHAHVVAAALFGEGMSSPLMDEVRERRGLVYYAACSADVMEWCGQFVVEASTAPEHLDPFFDAVATLLLQHARTIDPVHLERAHNQIVVRHLRWQEKPFRRLEQAALDLFAHGHVRAPHERVERLRAVSADEVRDAFEGMLAAGPAAAIAGKLGRGPHERVLQRLVRG